MENTVTITVKEYDELRAIEKSVKEKLSSDKMILYSDAFAATYFVLIGDDEKGVIEITHACKKAIENHNLQMKKVYRFIKILIRNRRLRKEVAGFKYEWLIKDKINDIYLDDDI